MKKLQFMLAALLFLVLAAFTMIPRSVEGVILDSQNQPVSQAIIQEKGTENAVSSDAGGHFKIEIKDKNAVLVITAVGFSQQEVQVGDDSRLRIVLVAAGKQLEEVVVTAFGVKKRTFVTHASTSLPGSSASLMSSSPVYGSVDPALETWRNNPDLNREGYDAITDNPFLRSTDHPLSTFSIDVDGASYSNIRRIINNGELPPAGAVRIEEMINYFTYRYPQPTGDAPFSITTEYAVCPWNENHQLVSIGLQGRKIPMENLPPANLVFLIDVSGSMWSADKLPLVQSAMKLLSDQLRPQDKVSIVVYAGSAGVKLPPTAGNETIKIKDAIDQLQAGGSTAGGAGIKKAYQIAKENFVKDGNNRVVLCTDGDFNVGLSSDDELERMIEEKRNTGIYLTVLGFGTGNYQDAKMQKLANKGNGNHAYIDNLSEARKVLISQFGGTLFTIAKDVKLQVEFNPAKVQGYRLIGYENRLLAKEDFNDDTKDAGELGSGHAVTALYEIIPTGVPAPELKKVDALKYQKPAQSNRLSSQSDDIMTVKFRYKKPAGDKSLLLEKVISGRPVHFNAASDNLHLAAGLAQFGMQLRNSEYKGRGGYQLALELVGPLAANDKEGYRKELVKLIKKAAGKQEQETAALEKQSKPLFRLLKDK